MGQKSNVFLTHIFKKTAKKRLEYACYLTGFNINIDPTIGWIGCRTRHQADGSGYRHDKTGTLIGEDILDGQGPKKSSR